MILPEKNNSLFCKSESFRNFIIHKFVNLPKYSYLCKQTGEFVILMFFRNRVMIWDDSKNRPKYTQKQIYQGKKNFFGEIQKQFLILQYKRKE